MDGDQKVIEPIEDKKSPSDREAAIRMDDPVLLKKDYILTGNKSRYLDLEALAAGGTSICYQASTEGGDPVLIKEVYPLALGRWLTRAKSGALVPVGKSEEARNSVAAQLKDYVGQSRREKGLEGLLVREGFKFFEPNYDWFLTNNTIYTVYRDYGEGTLAEAAGNVTALEAVGLIRRVLEPLKELHDTGYLHLDISPENILFGPMADKLPTLKFIDLGSLIKKEETLNMERFPSKDGYSPFELFSAPASREARELIGESTDTFSVGAVLYNLLTGKTISWEVCRRGNKSIISNECPACQASGYVAVIFDDDSIIGQPVTGLPPRALEAVNTFLSKALTNNPHKRFQSAGEMAAEADRLYEILINCQVTLGRMRLPDDFMDKEIEKEKSLGVLSKIGGVKRTVDDMLRCLNEKHVLVMDDTSLETSRRDIEQYINKYGDRYHEIAFIDEDQYECQLFDGTLEGSYGEEHWLEYDDKTLLVFFGRNSGLKSGIVAMNNMEGEHAYSVGFIRRQGPEPHVIRVLKPKSHKAVEMGTSLLRGAVTVLPWLVLFIFGFYMAAEFSVYGSAHQWKALFDPYQDPEGAGWLVIRQRQLLSDLRLFGPLKGSLGDWANIFDSHWKGFFMLLYAASKYGAGSAILMTAAVALIMALLRKRARGSGLGIAAFNIMAARLGLYLAYNLSLCPYMPEKLFTSEGPVLFSAILIAVMLLSPKASGAFKRYNGHEVFRFLLGIVSFEICFYLWRIKTAGGYGLVFTAVMLLFVWLVDYTYGIWLKDVRHKGGMTGYVKAFLKDSLKASLEDDLWDEYDEEEDEF